MALAKPDSAQPWNLRMLAEMPVAAVHFRSSCSFWSFIPPFSEHLVLSEIRVPLDLNGHVGIYPIDKPICDHLWVLIHSDHSTQKKAVLEVFDPTLRSI